VAATLLDQLGKLDTAEWISVVAGLIALASFVVAVRANHTAGEANALSETSNTIAEEANDIARASRDHGARSLELTEAEHEERQRKSEARSRLTATIEPTELSAPPGSGGNFVLTLNIRNVGERESGLARVAFYAPGYVDSTFFMWEEDRHNHGRTPSRLVPEVDLLDARGRPATARVLEREVPNIAPELPAQLRVIVPLQASQEPRTVQLRVDVSAEHAHEPMTETVEVTVSPELA